MGLSTKKRITIASALSIILISLPTSPVAAGNQGVVAPIIDRMAQALKGMNSLRAQLSQQKTYGQLGISDPVEEGELYIKRKKNKTLLVRLEIRRPSKRVITVKDSKFTLFQPSINQVIEGKVTRKLASGSSAAGFFSYLFGGLSQAGNDYNIVVLGQDVIKNRQTTHLKLTPRSQRTGLYRQIDLWVDNHLWLPTRQQFVETNRDVTLLQLERIQMNINLSDNLFSLKLPAGVQRVRS